MADKDMRAALEAALAPEEDTEEGTAVEAEATEEETSDAGNEAPVAHEEQSAEETTADEEVPVEYFGVDLSDLPPDARKDIIAGFQERDKFIQQLLRDKSDSPDGAEASPEASTEAAEEASDADILRALGVDPDDPFSEATAKVALPLAKMVLALNEQVEGLSRASQVSATERYWETSLDALEAQYGKLPISRDEVFKTAAESGIAEPMDAYWRIMGPTRSQVLTEVQKRRADAVESLKKGSPARPKPQADTSTKAIIEAKDVKQAMRIAYEQYAKEQGL